MKLEDHPGHFMARTVHWMPLFVFGTHLFASPGDDGPHLERLTVFRSDGRFECTIFPGPHNPNQRWMDQTFTAEDQRTIWALAQLHR